MAMFLDKCRRAVVGEEAKSGRGRKGKIKLGRIKLSKAR